MTGSTLSSYIGMNTINASSSYTLGVGSLNLILTGGIAYNVNISGAGLATVYGNPSGWADYLDYYQGDNSFGYQNDCGIVTCENMLIQMGLLDFKEGYSGSSNSIDLLESMLVEYAKGANLIDTSYYIDYYNGGMHLSSDCPALLEYYGLSATVLSESLNDIGQSIKDNYTVAVAVDAYVLWGYSGAFSSINHAVLISGAAYDADDNILGFYICDSGEQKKSCASEYISYDDLSEAYGGLAIVSESNTKLYIDNIDGTGNLLDNNIVGNYGNNVLSGLDGNDSLYGGYGQDTLLGGGGNDVLDGGLGVDKMSGGAGDDIYFVDSCKDIVFELNNSSADNGNDTIVLTEDFVINSSKNSNQILKYTLFKNVENLDLSALNTFSLISYANNLNNSIIGGSGSDTVFALDGDDFVSGGVGDDYIDGGVGKDTLVGGEGNDIYFVDNSNDIVIDLGSDENDKIILSKIFVGNSFDLSSSQDNVEFVDASSTTKGINISASISNETILGGHGNDTVFANESNIYINGENGNDSLIGGLGNDTIIGGVGKDTLKGGLGENYLYGGAGNDVYLINNIGNENDFIFDESGIDTIKLLSGYLGDSYRLENSFEDLDASDVSTNFNLVGNQLSNTIFGTSANDTISGGDDKIYDLLSGGGGNDCYIIYKNDVVCEKADKGIDTIVLGAESDFEYFSLADTNVEILDASLNLTNHVLLGSENSDTILGGDFTDYIITSSGDDYLFGGWGNDYLVGGQGSDVYSFDASSSDYDSITEFFSDVDRNVISIINTKEEDVFIYKNSDGHYIIDYGAIADANKIDLGLNLNISKVQIVDGENNVTGYIAAPQIENIINTMSSFNTLDSSSSYATLADVVVQKSSDIQLVSWN